MRVLVRVPEAYLLLRPFDTTRPGLLVLDADARRVASVPLTGRPIAADVADRLTKAQGARPRERVLLRMPEAAVSEAVKALTALQGAEVAKALPGGFVEVWGAKSAVTPIHVATIATALKAEIGIVDPVAVVVTAAREGATPAEAAKAVAGLRHVMTNSDGTTAWISRWLLHPGHLEAAGLDGNVAAVTYHFENLPRGAPVVKHLMRPFAEKGVLSVVPRVDDGAIEVVVRPEAYDADATLAALVGGGLKSKP